MRLFAKKTLAGLLAFIGWLLSPFTPWNDVFVNVPLSYLLANLLYYLTRLPLKWLLVGSYLFTNVLGLALLFVSGRCLILSSRDRLRAVLIMLLLMLAFTALAVYLDRQGKLLPLGELLRKR